MYRDTKKRKTFSTIISVFWFRDHFWLSVDHTRFRNVSVTNYPQNNYSTNYWHSFALYSILYIQFHMYQIFYYLDKRKFVKFCEKYVLLPLCNWIKQTKNFFDIYCLFSIKKWFTMSKLNKFAKKLLIFHE